MGGSGGVQGISWCWRRNLGLSGLEEEERWRWWGFGGAGELGGTRNPPIPPPPEFVVEEEEGIFAPGRFVERLTVPGEQPWAPLTLSPYGRYRFRVLAANAYGRGEPSAPSAPISTPPAGECPPGTPKPPCPAPPPTPGE